MAWNQSTGSAAKPPRKAQSGVGKGLLAGGLVVVLAGAAVWFFMGQDPVEKKTPEPRKSSAIKSVTPAAAPKAVQEEPKKPKIEIRKLENGLLMKYRDGKPAWLYPRQPPTAVVITNSPTPSREEKIFHNPAEAQIAMLLNIEPGEGLVGDSDSMFGRAFRRYLDKSFVEPTLVMHDDPEDVKELKRAVNDVKAELKQRMDAGEDPCKILAETRDDLRQLGAYRQELEAEVRKIAKENKELTPAELEDYVSAANKMLEERGAKKIALPKFFMRQAQMRAAELQQQEKGQ